MAVEAHHLRLFPSQLLRNREIINAGENQASNYNTQMSFVAPVSGTTGSFIPLYNPTTHAAASESSLTFNNLAATTAAVTLPKKRLRDSDHPLSFLGEDISSHVHQQMLDIDRLIVQHVENLRVELTERRKRFARQILAAIEERVSKRLKAKEEEIERMGKLNWALEERIKSLCVENQIWRNMAQTNEATANVLRTNLEQVLAAQMKVEEEHKVEAAAGGGATDVEDAESCCCGENQEEEGKVMVSGWQRLCRNCRVNEPSVLLLPCRHLCLCAACGPAIDACPICKCCKNGTVNVNMS
ncbi:probable BOI-related E3 ubiquitin-protein ligase 3 [Elaeis guineensis]|uniref:Probable BOI-related E3 ubiquitin-protein ligase 3 n=1 Tax=Elaeis guineensis var. tenera TaxID=51953 RepID=A0A6I9QG42_ELAGV|nr:probable BOI-related E3 ubiquitin-protein ligase 3 [Elaeis guineensis]